MLFQFRVQSRAQFLQDPYRISKSTFQVLYPYCPVRVFLILLNDLSLIKTRAFLASLAKAIDWIAWTGLLDSRT